MNNKDMLINLPELNPECFIYDNWEANWWNLLDIDYGDAVDIKVIMRSVKQYAIGYCESNRTRIRPRDDSYAVMFEKDKERFWFHIQKWEFEDEEDDCE